MKIQCYTRILLSWLIFLGAGCNLLEITEQSNSFHANGPYWDGPVQNFTVGHVLNYFQQLRTLSEEAIVEEAERASKAYADLKRPVDAVQYLLVLAISSPPAENKQMMELFSELKENTAFMRTDVQELLFLIKATASSNLASQLHETSADIVIKKARSNTAELERKLKACNEQSKTLAGQIQKLKDIERILTDRSLSTEQQ